MKSPSKQLLQLVWVILVLTGIINARQLPAQIHELQDHRAQALTILTERGEVYLSMAHSDLYKNQDLLTHLSIDFFEGNRVFVYCNHDAFAMLQDKGLDFRVERSPGDVDYYELNMKNWEQVATRDLTQSWDFYPTYEAYVNLMYQFQQDHPNRCQIHNIATLSSSRSLLFARISSNLNADEPKPRFMYTSTMHGDETTGFILSLRLIHYLLTNYGVIDEITYLLDNMEIWICPNENPDGTYTNNNNTVSGATRSNASGVDLNRNYPNPVSNPSTPIQPETQAMMNLTDTLHFVMSANMHGGIECVNYPWDSWLSSARTHADHVWWQMVSHEYADTARFYSPSNYMNPSGSSFNNGVTHGGDWYVVTGSRQDFMNYYRNQRELTLELSNTKLLPAAQLPAHWEYNRRSLINYMKQALNGMRGTVTDLYTGEPLEAKIELISHDKDNSFVFSFLPHGDFYRPLKAGVYSLQVSADGYNPVVMSNISVTDYQITWVDVQLAGENPFAPPHDLIAHTGNFNSVYLEWSAPQQESTKREKSWVFFDPVGYKVFRDGVWLGDTEHTHYYDSDLPEGTYEYFVKAVYNEPQGTSHPSESIFVTLAVPEYFTIIASAGENGTISPQGEIQVVQGYNKTFSVQPDEGYEIEDVKVDGNSVGPVSSYTFQHVEGNHEIVATFNIWQPQTFTLTFNVRDIHQQAIDNAVITLQGQAHPSGQYVITGLESGQYSFMVAAAEFYPTYGSLEIAGQDHTEEVVLVAAPTLVHELDEQTLVVFPNPARDHLHLRSSKPIMALVLLDMTGKEVFRTSVASEEASLQLTGIMEGVYMLRIYLEDGTMLRKLVVH